MSHVAAALAVAILACGCATTTPYPATEEQAWLPPLDGKAGLAPLPLAVGLHIPPDVGTRALSTRRFNATVTFTGNETIVPYFDWATRQLFAKVLRLEAWRPGAPIPDALSAVVELSEVTATSIRIRLHTGERAHVDWQILAFSNQPSNSQAQQPAVRDVTNRVRDAIAQYLLQFAAQPEIKAWLAREGAAPAPQSVTEQAAAPGGTQDIAIIGNESDAMSCVGERLAKQPTNARFSRFERVQIDMFPWLEPSILPRAEDEAAFWARPEIRHKSRAGGVRYLMNFHGWSSNSKDTDAVGCGAYGCFGVATGTRQSRFWVKLWDLWDGRLLVDEAAEKSGAYAMPFFFLPIPILPATETAACEDLAQRIRAGIRSAAAP